MNFRVTTLFLFLFINNSYFSQSNASFNADITSGCSPLVVNFTNTSTNSISHTWDFGNGTTASNSNSLSFDGQDDYIIISNPIIPTSGNFSVSFWANTSVLSNTYAEILSQGSAGTGFYIGYDSKTNSFGSTYSNVTCLGSGAESTSSNQAIVGNSSVNSFRIYGSWSNVSDRRDKYDIVDTQYGLDFLNKLRVVDYKYNYRNRYKHFNDETKENYYETNNKQYACKRTHTGLISQEVKEVLDSENKDHSLFQINNYTDSDKNTDDAQFIVYQETISMCVKAIQELSARVIELEKKIN